MSFKPYETLITLTYAMCICSVYLMWVNNEMIWLIAVFIASWFNHFIFSLNHRLISHKSFTARNKFIHNSIILLNVFQFSHSPLRFSMLHRHHHAYADVPGKDVHGPTTGLWESVIGWEYNTKKTIKELNIKLPRDLMRDKFLVWFDTHFYKILFVTSLIVCIISWKLFLYVMIPGSVFFKLTASYFSNYHNNLFGYVNYDLGQDTAKNNVLSNVFTFGEGWHNNHHAHPNNWQFGQKWWEWDPTAFMINHFLMERK